MRKKFEIGNVVCIVNVIPDDSNYNLKVGQIRVISEEIDIESQSNIIKEVYIAGYYLDDIHRVMWHTQLKLASIKQRVLYNLKA
jgi:hypothetical protein